MFTQFFGNFLLSKNIITTEQFLNAMKEQNNTHIKLGTLAMHAGLMTSKEVDQVVIKQTHEDKRFGEIAIKDGYLTSDQVQNLLTQQTPDYLLLGQILIEQGLLSNATFETLLADYQTESEIYDLNVMTDHRILISQLVSGLYGSIVSSQSSHFAPYLELLFNNLIRFIGDDFTPLNPSLCKGYEVQHCAVQEAKGAFALYSMIDMDTSTSIQFASRYAKESFAEYDEYVEASMQDFINLHNGLFNVNLSNTKDTELVLEPPVSYSNQLISYEDEIVLIPVIFTFGHICFLVKVS